MEPTFVNLNNVDLRALVRTAYDLSKPEGWGFTDYRSGPLDDATTKEIVDVKLDAYLPGTRLRMDYVHGRRVKLAVFCITEHSPILKLMPDLPIGTLYMSGPWHSHTADQWQALLQRIGATEVPYPASDPEFPGARTGSDGMVLWMRHDGFWWVPKEWANANETGSMGRRATWEDMK